MSKTKLSVVLATFNEEANIARCLESVKDVANEIVIVDGESTDKAVEIAKKFGTEESSSFINGILDKISKDKGD